MALIPREVLSDGSELLLANPSVYTSSTEGGRRSPYGVFVNFSWVL